MSRPSLCATAIPPSRPGALLTLALAAGLSGCADSTLAPNSDPDRLNIATLPFSGAIYVGEPIAVVVTALADGDGGSSAEVVLDTTLPEGLELVSEETIPGPSRAFGFVGREAGSYPLSFSYRNGTPTGTVTVEVFRPIVFTKEELKVLLQGETTTVDAYLGGTDGCPIPNGASQIDFDAGPVDATATIMDAPAAGVCPTAENGVMSIELHWVEASGALELLLWDRRYPTVSRSVPLWMLAFPVDTHYTGTTMEVQFIRQSSTCEEGEIDMTPINMTWEGRWTDRLQMYTGTRYMVGTTPQPGELEVRSDGYESLEDVQPGLFALETWIAAANFARWIASEPGARGSRTVAAQEAVGDVHIVGEGEATIELFQKVGDDYLPVCVDRALISFETDGVGGLVGPEGAGSR